MITMGGIAFLKILTSQLLQSAPNNAQLKGHRQRKFFCTQFLSLGEKSTFTPETCASILYHLVKEEFYALRTLTGSSNLPPVRHWSFLGHDVIWWDWRLPTCQQYQKERHGALSVGYGLIFCGYRQEDSSFIQLKLYVI